MVRINHTAIEKQVWALLKRLWAARGQLRSGINPLDLLDPAFIAKVLGLQFVIEESLGSYSERGVQFEVAGILDRKARRVLVSRKFGRAVMRFTAAHEIAHFLLHPNEVMHRDRPMDAPDPQPRSKIEAEAEYFAACLLMPENLLKTDFSAAFGTQRLEFHEDVAFALRVRNLQKALSPNESTHLRERLVARTTVFGDKTFERSLADRYGVSVSAMAHRLNELKLVGLASRRGLAHPLNERVQRRTIEAISRGRNLLPTTRALLSDAPSVKRVRLLAMNHALRDTQIFLEELIGAGAQVGCFVAKPNSIDESAVEGVMRLGVLVTREPPGTSPPYSHFENSSVLGDLLVQQVDIARSEGRKLLIVDVGGYFCKPLLERTDVDFSSIAGVIEVTTFGFNRYLEQEKSLPVPVLSVARSPLKEAEAVYVGQSSLRAAEDLLQQAGKAITGKTCAVIGYGMIGKQIARALQGRGLTTLVHDVSPVKMVGAHMDGFATGSLAEVLAVADLVFSSTGGLAVGFLDLAHAKSGAVLLSAGSRTQEFDVLGLQASAVSRRLLTEKLEEFEISRGHTCVLANRGKPVNFLKDGTPEEIIDLVFAEIAACVRYLIENRVDSGRVNELSKEHRENVARVFLENQRRSDRRRS